MIWLDRNASIQNRLRELKKQRGAAEPDPSSTPEYRESSLFSPVPLRKVDYRYDGGSFILALYWQMLGTHSKN
jgi:hypothetical protein